MSDLPELPPLPQPDSEIFEWRNEYGRQITWGYSPAKMLSFAREAMERGRRAGLEEAARIAQKAIEAYRAALLEHAATKNVDTDKGESLVDAIEDLMWELERKEPQEGA